MRCFRLTLRTRMTWPNNQEPHPSLLFVFLVHQIPRVKCSPSTVLWKHISDNAELRYCFSSIFMVKCVFFIIITTATPPDPKQRLSQSRTLQIKALLMGMHDKDPNKQTTMQDLNKRTSLKTPQVCDWWGMFSFLRRVCGWIGTQENGRIEVKVR